MPALSRAPTSRPRMLLLDEISMGLAPVLVQEMHAVVIELATEGVTTLLVEQLVGDVLEIAGTVNGDAEEKKPPPSRSARRKTNRAKIGAAG
jgi:ABC-type branched-subunit amino acid transport system ATPase component